MNKEEYVFILLVNIVVFQCALAGWSNHAFPHHHRVNAHHTKHRPFKWNENTVKLKDENNEENLQPPSDISGQDDINEQPEDPPDLEEYEVEPDPQDEPVLLAEEELSHPSKKRQNHPKSYKKRPVQGFKDTLDGEEAAVDIEEAEDPENVDDYARQISYDPNLPVLLKNKERSKRLIANNKEEETENLEEDPGQEYDKADIPENEEDLYKELLIDENALESSTKTQELNKYKKTVEKHSVPSILTTGSPSKHSKVITNERIPTKPTELKNLLLSKVLKKSPTEISDPKSNQNIQSKAMQNGTSQGVKNVVELNKAYKLLLCAANKFIKIANKTLMDRMADECTTLTTTSKINNKSTTGDSIGDDCCANIKGGVGLTATSQRSVENIEESEDSLVEELLDMTVKPKKKTGIRTNKELLSWIQNHDNGAYDTFPGMHILPERVDPNVYVYGDYDNADTGEDYDEQAVYTQFVKKPSTSTDIIKASSRSYELSSSPKPTGSLSKTEEGDAKQIVTKSISTNRTKSSSTSRMWSPVQGQSLIASTELKSADEDATPSEIKSKLRKATPRNHLPRRLKPVMNMRKMRYNKKFLPLSLLRTAAPRGLSEESAIEEINSTHRNKEIGVALQPGNTIEEQINAE